MYSKDRSKALEYTISCLEKMKEYVNCQKILVFDGTADHIPQGWDHIEVPRKNGEFCWARMWDAGVCASKHNNVLYLDSDRLLPHTYLTQVLSSIKDGVFVFTSNHYMMTMEASKENCHTFIESNDPLTVLSDPEFLGFARFEPRTKVPLHQPSKNVMSGSTAFTKRTYFELGGVDHWYCGHGAFADTDFHMQAATSGCSFVDLNCTELHYLHTKVNNNQRVYSSKELHMMSLGNFIYYCDKWNLPITLAESLAQRIGIDKPSNYVNDKLREIKSASKG